ncbi:YcxB family protein [Algibacter aquimarinus]|uniref:YcxB family protein n=1 Tax=Algibacter aquimarinus TaxID=1136748 RepID=UPI0031E73B9F
MIQTKKYALTKNEYSKIVISKRLKKSWWLYLLMFLLGVLYLPKFGEDSFSTFFVLFSFFYPFLMFTYLYFWSRSKGHQPIFAETSLCFDDEFLYFKGNKNETKLNPDSIQKIISKPKYWLLYMSKAKFIYIPKHIFFSEEDYRKFSNLIN